MTKISDFEMKRIKLELIKVNAAKAELEFKIEERLEDIKRIREHIALQEAREDELKAKIQEEENKE